MSNLASSNSSVECDPEAADLSIIPMWTPGCVHVPQSPSPVAPSVEVVHESDRKDVSSVDCRENRASLYRDALRQQRKTWGATFHQEFWFYVKNTHEVLAISLQHPKHAISRLQRVTMLIVMSSISLAFWYASECLGHFSRFSTEWRGLSLSLVVSCSALALDAQSGLSDQYSNGTVAVLLSVGAILESLVYRAAFSCVNFLGWLLCTESSVASSHAGLLVKDLFSGVGPLYTSLMLAWAAFITAFSLLTALRVGGVPAKDIFIVWGLERLHTWTWQYCTVAVIVFVAGRRREKFERTRQASQSPALGPADPYDASSFDGEGVRETDRLVDATSDKPRESAPGSIGDLHWDELQWWANHDFSS
jgi:hypothetical protein